MESCVSGSGEMAAPLSARVRFSPLLQAEVQPVGKIIWLRKLLLEPDWRWATSWYCDVCAEGSSEDRTDRDLDDRLAV